MNTSSPTSTDRATIGRLRARRNRQRGMTLLEIMIVLAILALVMGFLIGPRVMDMFGESKEDLGKLKVKDLVETAYPLYQRKHADKPCPSWAELNKYANVDEKKLAEPQKDPWGNEYRLLCGPDAPAGSKGFAVMSMGPDGKPNTDDDIKSWE